jgi:hypothetical protein
MKLLHGTRRGAERHLAGWSGRYRLTDDPDMAWRPCQVHDVSDTGAGLELPGEDRMILSAAYQRVELEVRNRAGQPAGIVPRGTVRNVTDTDHGQRVGFEFCGLTDLERDVIAVLLNE